MSMDSPLTDLHDPPGLPKRAIGDTGIEVSVIGLGTVKLGRNQQVKYPASFNLPDDRAVRNLLARASELGINLLDTAPAYGTSESRLGALLTGRENWIICTKVGEHFTDGNSTFAFDADSVRLSIENSLRCLRTDYLDIVLIHSDGNDLDILNHTDCVETLEALRQKGLIRSIGMSGKTVAGGLQALQQLDLAMVTYNPASTAEGVVIDHAARYNKGILIKKALNSGHLSIAGQGERNGNKGQAGADSMPDPEIQRTNEAGASTQRTNEAGASKGKNAAANALSFALGRPGVSSVIVGTINPDHLQANAAVALKSNGNA